MYTILIPMKAYKPRIMDHIITETLEYIGAILLAGPKWCGKTTSAMQIAQSVLKMQDPDVSLGYMATAETKPSLLLQGKNPRLIDEWQVAPVLWDAVRTAVDERGKNGLFILTGSTSVDDDAIMHSGTGRIAKLLMRPMSLFESDESNGKISLQALFNTKNYAVDGIESTLSIENLVFAACRGGWPASVTAQNNKAALFVAQNYIENICETDISAVDGIKRSPTRVRAILQSYSRNISTMVNNTTILKDIKTNFSDMSEATLYSYINALSRLFVIADIPAWNPSIRSATSIRSSTKKEFIDPSIAVASLGLNPDQLLVDFNTFGFIFETLCIRDLHVYSQKLGGSVSYYHDRYGLEADAVLHLKNGRYALIECKLGANGIEEGAQHLLELQNLIEKHNAKNQAQLKRPEFLMILTGGKIAYQRKDGVYIIPIGCLRD